MAVSEQTDSLRVLGSDPVDYLVTPRVAACMIAGPILNLMCFCMGAKPAPAPAPAPCGRVPTLSNDPLCCILRPQ